MSRKQITYPLLTLTFKNSPELVLFETERNSTIVFVERLENWRKQEPILVIKKDYHGNIVIPSQKEIKEQTYNIFNDSEFKDCANLINEILNIN